ncbi:hypothetical protein AUJ65_05560 [Candidatus Micrarchaeota archaeon CG1_02_51_15]|nr:MAG: hypothetical protein AUJ65_05560 [Candidatus Micrarchaeota archaeon CG1_02_51_15]
MLKEIEELRKKWPIEGIALHGTPYENIADIRKKGITRGQPYVCPISHLDLNKYDLDEVLRRSIGSALFASNYSFKNFRLHDQHKEHLPAIVVLLGKLPYEFLPGYDEDVTQYVAYGGRRNSPERKESGLPPVGREYKSFGKQPKEGIPADRIKAVVRLTMKDVKEIRKAARNDFDARRMLRARLAVKTLAAVRKLVERQSRK